MDRQYLMVRAMTSQPVHFEEFFGNEVVAVGWSRTDFTGYDSTEELRVAVREEYYKDKKGPRVAMNLNECARFKSINPGDLIIVPYYSGIALATAEEGELYSKQAAEIDLANQHRVKYKYNGKDILSVPRNNLSEGLQRRLRVPGKSVTDLSEFADEIEKLYKSADAYSYSSEIKRKADELEQSFKNQLLEKIRSGKTNLQTGGIGLENLVKELFECEGYDASVMSKNSFPGMADADIKASRTDDFSSITIYAQVKHHEGITGRYGIEQIIKAVEYKQDEGEECKGLFITTAMVENAEREYAEDNGIGVIDGERLVEIIYSNRTRLSENTRNKLGIIMVPSVSDL